MRRVLSILLLAVGLAAGALTRDPTEKEKAMLPDITSKTVACSACTTAVEELQDALLDAKRRKAGGRLSELEMMEATEEVCDSKMRDYGLLMVNNEMTAEYSKNDQIARAQGNWITIKWQSVCAEMLNEYEEYLFENYETEHYRLKGAICHQMADLCNAEQQRENGERLDAMLAKGEEEL